jgi:hypothetical protein
MPQVWIHRHEYRIEIFVSLTLLSSFFFSFGLSGLYLRGLEQFDGGISCG